MSRFIAHIRHTAPGMPDDQIDCDSAHIDEQGNLRLSRHIRDGNATTVDTFGCYQAAFWASYRLEAPPADDTDGRPADEPKPPKVGDLVHFMSAERRDCLPSFVYRANPNGSLVVWPEFDAGPYPREATQDESRQAEFSWHWPCDSDQTAATPAPGEPAPPVHVIVHLDGDALHDAITQNLLRALKRNGR